MTKASDSKSIALPRSILTVLACCITLGLIWGLMTRRPRMLAAQQAANEAKEELVVQKGKYERLAELEREVAAFRIQESESEQSIRAVIQTMSREEFREDLVRAIENANLDTTMVFKESNLSSRASFWIWVPEKAHTLWFQMTPDFSDSALLPERGQPLREGWSLPLKPRKLHLVNFSIEKRRHQDQCVLRLEFDNELLAEQTISGHNSRGWDSGAMIGQGGFFRTGYLGGLEVLYDWDQLPSGTWLTIANKKMHFETQTPATEEAIVKIRMALRSDSPVYVSGSSKQTLKHLDFELGEPLSDEVAPVLAVVPITRWPIEREPKKTTQGEVPQINP